MSGQTRSWSTVSFSFSFFLAGTHRHSGYHTLSGCDAFRRLLVHTCERVTAVGRCSGCVLGRLRTARSRSQTVRRHGGWRLAGSLGGGGWRVMRSGRLREGCINPRNALNRLSSANNERQRRTEFVWATLWGLVTLVIDKLPGPSLRKHFFSVSSYVLIFHFHERNRRVTWCEMPPPGVRRELHKNQRRVSSVEWGLPHSLQVTCTRLPA